MTPHQSTTVMPRVSGLAVSTATLTARPPEQRRTQQVGDDAGIVQRHAARAEPGGAGVLEIGEQCRDRRPAAVAKRLQRGETAGGVLST